MRLEAETGAQHKSLIFFSTPPAPVVIVVVLRQALQTGLAHHVNDTRTLLQGRAAAEDSYIHPAACLTEGRVVGGVGGTAGWSRRPLVALLLSHHV